MAAKITGFHDIIAPQVIKFNSNSLLLGGTYASVLGIIDYPENVNHAWIAKASQLPGVICSIHVTPTDSYELVKSINKSINRTLERLISVRIPLIRQRSEKKIKHAEALLDKLDNEKQNIFFLSVLFMVTARSEKELLNRAKKVKSTLGATGMLVRELSLKQEDGLRALAPLNQLPKPVSEVVSRNMPAETIAASFPFTVSGMNDGKGIILGRDKDNGVVLTDIWKRGSDRGNSNFLVLGKPGVGKSTTVKKILTNSFAQGCKVIVIDPEREYKKLCERVGGSWIDAGGQMGDIINPLQVRAVPTADGSNKGAVAKHFQTLRIFFSLYLKEIDDIERAKLEEAIELLYKNFNIDWDTNPHDLKPTDWPIIQDLYDLVLQLSEKDNKLERVATLLRKLAIGSDAGLWNGHTSIDGNSQFICLDTYSLQESSLQLRRTQLFNILSWCWNEVAKDIKEKVVVAIDEAYLLIDKNTPEALVFLRNTSKRIRKYEGSLIILSQNVNDFLDKEISRHGQALLDNPTYKLIMGLGEADLKAIRELMNLSEAETLLINNGIRGESLFVAGNKRLYTRIELTRLEIELFGDTGGR